MKEFFGHKEKNRFSSSKVCPRAKPKESYFTRKLILRVMKIILLISPSLQVLEEFTYGDLMIYFNLLHDCNQKIRSLLHGNA
jgi:hypothetical protein